jgi:5-methyltetrahydropteroyltriglutamate--homocysteine methyltransferase
MVERFVKPMSGIQWPLSATQLEAYRERTGMAYRRQPPGIVVGPVGKGELNVFENWDLVRSLTDAPLKFTLTSPYMLAKVTADAFYHDTEALALAFADVLAGEIASVEAEIVQIDEPNLPGTPADGAIAAKAINRILKAVRSVKAVHLCFGNYRGQTIQSGDYASLIRFMNDLECDHLVVETTRREFSDIEKLKELRPDLKIGIGVIDVKDSQIESAATVAGRIERLANALGEDRIAYVHPDCGLQHLPIPVADGKLHALAAGRNLFAG